MLSPTPNPNGHKSRRLRMYGWLRGNLSILQNMFPKRRVEHLHMTMEVTIIFKQGGALEEDLSKKSVQDSNLPLIYRVLKYHSYPSIEISSSVMFSEKSS